MEKPAVLTALTRRSLAIQGAGLAMLAAMPRAARADTPWLHDPVVVYADHALRPALDSLGTQFAQLHGAPVKIFAAAPTQSIGLLEHATQCDVLITLTPAMDQAAAGAVLGDARSTLWRTRLVFASLAPRPSAALPDGPPAGSFSPETLRDAVGAGKLAVTDPTHSATFNGWQVLDRAGLTGILKDHVQGALNTEQAAGMLRTGDATVALLHATEAAAIPGLRVLMTVPDTAYSPITYDMALTKTAWSRHQAALMSWLAGLPDGRLHELGLEHPA